MSPWSSRAAVGFMWLMLAASVRAQEVLVPIDEAGKITAIDAKLEQKLELFPEVKGFREARLYQVSDSSYVLEISYLQHDEQMRERRMLTAEECVEFRARVSRMVGYKAPAAIYDQEGRASLIATNLTLAMGFYGWAIPFATQMEGDAAVASSYMIMSSAGFFVPYMITQKAEVTKGMAWFSMYGGTRGIGHGIAVAYLLGGEQADNDEGRGIVGSGVLFSLGEAWAGYGIAQSMHMTQGTAAAIGSLTDFGTLEGLGLAHQAELLSDDHDISEAMGLALGGTAVGLAAGFRLTRSQTYTRGDARILNYAGWLGAGTAVGLAHICEASDDKVYGGVAMAGAVIGLALGNHLVHGKDFGTGQGRLTELSSLAGALTGLGLATTFDPNGNHDKLYSSLTTAGALAGFALMYRHEANSAEMEEHDSSWNLQVHPAGLLTTILDDDTAVPALSLDIRW